MTDTAFLIALDKIQSSADLDEKVLAGLTESFTATGRQISDVLLRAEGNGYFVVSGSHRTEAARRAGWTEIRCRVVPFETEEDQLRAELLHLDENDIRKDVSAADRALHAARRLEIHQILFPSAPKRGGDRKSAEAKNDIIEKQKPAISSKKSKSPGETLIAAGAVDAEAAASGLSRSAAGKALRRGKELGKETLKRVKPHAHLNKTAELDALIELPPERREEVLKAAEEGKTLKATTVVKQEQRRLKEIQLAGQAKAITGKWTVIYADPPWQFLPWSRESGMDRAAENHYATMSTDDIKAMPISDIAHDDAVCFMWATIPLLPEAIEALRLWGFTYRSHVVWVKETAGTGYWLRQQHELLLIGTRGDIPAPSPGMQRRSVIDARRGPHSVKPEEAYDLIESYFPTASKIELFQRSFGRPARRGWSVHGNESSDAAAAEPPVPPERQPAPKAAKTPLVAGAAAAPVEPNTREIGSPYVPPKRPELSEDELASRRAFLDRTPPAFAVSDYVAPPDKDEGN